MSMNILVETRLAPKIIFDKEKPQSVDASIRIKVNAENINEELEYKFLIGKGGIWSVIKDFSRSNQCLWVIHGGGLSF